MTIFGWDASHYDSDGTRGPMDMVAAKKAGVQFFTHKVTEGTSYVDGMSPSILAKARAAGIALLGGYHVLHSGNINAQVNWFIHHLPSWWDEGPFLVQLDVEHWPTDSPPPADVMAWCARFQAVTGRAPVIYASRGQYGDTLKATRWPLWNAAYPSGTARLLASAYAATGGDSSPNWASYSGHAPVIWQYTSNATIGSQQSCDANAYRGTIEQLKALAGGDPEVEQQDVVQYWNGKGRTGVRVGWVLGDLENLRDTLTSAGGKGSVLDATAPALADTPIAALASLGKFMDAVAAKLAELSGQVEALAQQVEALAQQQVPTSLTITGGTIQVSGGQVTTEPGQ